MVSVKLIVLQYFLVKMNLTLVVNLTLPVEYVLHFIGGFIILKFNVRLKTILMQGLTPPKFLVIYCIKSDQFEKK